MQAAWGEAGAKLQSILQLLAHSHHQPTDGRRDNLDVSRNPPCLAPPSLRSEHLHGDGAWPVGTRTSSAWPTICKRNASTILRRRSLLQGSYQQHGTYLAAALRLRRRGPLRWCNLYRCRRRRGAASDSIIYGGGSVGNLNLKRALLSQLAAPCALQLRVPLVGQGLCPPKQDRRHND